MFPSVMLVVPFYAVLSKYHMTNKLIGLIIVYAATNVAFSTWMLVSYFKTVPIELDEAARVDGASSFRIFWNIILPLIVPGIAAVAIFVLFSGWNEYMYSSVLISNDQLKTLTVGIISLNSQYQIKWNDLMAASTVSSLPLVVLFICFQYMQPPMWPSAHGCWFPTLRQYPLSWTRRPGWTGHPASEFFGTSYCP